MKADISFVKEQDTSLFYNSQFCPEAQAAQIAQRPVASDILWDRIVSIESLGRQQVYDIEVEGTHNFIGNGIFAHNTYIQQPVSSPLAEPVTSDKGGIDLRALPIVTQPQGLGRSPLQGESPAGRVPILSFDLDKEWREIQNMLNTGIIPSSERIKEYLINCCQNKDLNQEIDKVLACLADILRLEEERVSSTEPALKEMLVLLESDKSLKEFQLTLADITVLPKEPKLIGE